jgi:hypothetical protein
MARSKTPPVKIIIDVHERQSGIADTLAELGAEIEMAQLPAGDYAVGANTLVERKRVLDLTPLSSRAASGRSSASFAQPVPFPTSSLQSARACVRCTRKGRSQDRQEGSSWQAWLIPPNGATHSSNAYS